MGRPHRSFSVARINQCPIAVIKERGNHRELSRLVNDQTKVVGNNLKTPKQVIRSKTILENQLNSLPIRSAP